MNAPRTHFYRRVGHGKSARGKVSNRFSACLQCQRRFERQGLQPDHLSHAALINENQCRARAG
jgi:hypothetical protein